MLNNQKSSLEEIKKHHAATIRLLLMRDLYFATNYFLLAILKPIDQQGDSRRSNQTIALALIGVLQALNLTFEFIKVKKLLNPSLELKIERIIRHGVNGTKDIAIIFTFLQVLDALANPSTDSASDEDIIRKFINASLAIKLPVVSVLCASKAAIGYFLNKREYDLHPEAEEEQSRLQPKALYERPWTRLTLMRTLGLAAIFYLKGAVFAAIDLLYANDFDLKTSESFNQKYIFTKPAVQTALFLLLLDHPVYPSTKLRRGGRFLHRFLTMAVENAEISLAVILNLLSYFANDEDYNPANASAAALLFLSYGAACFPAEAHFNITAICNDKDAIIQTKTKSAGFFLHLGWAGVLASTLSPQQPMPWLYLSGFAMAADIFKLLMPKGEFYDKNFVITLRNKHLQITAKDGVNLPKNLLKIAADGGIAFLVLDSVADSITLPFKILIAASSGLLIKGMQSLGTKFPYVRNIHRIIDAGLLANAGMVVINTLPSTINPNLSLWWRVGASLGSAAIATALEARQIKKTCSNFQELESDNENSIPHGKIIRGVSKAGIGMLLSYNMAMRQEETNEPLSATITTLVLLLLFISSLYYLRYVNAGGETIGNRLSSCGLFKPRQRYETKDLRLDDARDIINQPL